MDSFEPLRRKERGTPVLRAAREVYGEGEGDVIGDANKVGGVRKKSGSVAQLGEEVEEKLKAKPRARRKEVKGKGEDGVSAVEGESGRGSKGRSRSAMPLEGQAVESRGSVEVSGFRYPKASKRGEFLGKLTTKNKARSGAEADSKAVFEARSRSGTPLELEEAAAQDEKQAAKGKIRKLVVSKQSRKASPTLQSESEEDSRPVSRTKSRSTTPSEGLLAADEQLTTDIRSRKVVVSKNAKAPESEPESEEIEEDFGSDGLSDFIVNDSTFHEEEEVPVIDMPPPPPRSTRKLVQGRRPKKDEFDDDDLDLELQRLNIKDDVHIRGGRGTKEEKGLKAFAVDFSDEETVKKSVPRKLFGDVRIEPPNRMSERSPKKQGYVSSSDIEDPFTLR